MEHYAHLASQPPLTSVSPSLVYQKLSNGGHHLHLTGDASGAYSRVYLCSGISSTSPHARKEGCVPQGDAKPAWSERQRGFREGRVISNSLTFLHERVTRLMTTNRRDFTMDTECCRASVRLTTKRQPHL